MRAFHCARPPWAGHALSTAPEATATIEANVRSRVAITEDGKIAVLSRDQRKHWGCAVAEPQVTQGRHWFEVKILDPGDDRGIIIGWSAPGLDLEDILNDDDDGGCAW